MVSLPSSPRVREKEGSRAHSAMRAVLGLVESSHAQTTDVTRLVVAGRDRVELDGLGANEARLAVGACSIVGIGCGAGNQLGVRFRRSLLCARGMGLGRSAGVVTASATTGPLSSAARSSIVASSSSSATSSTVAIASGGVGRVGRSLRVNHRDGISSGSGLDGWGSRNQGRLIGWSAR